MMLRTQPVASPRLGGSTASGLALKAIVPRNRRLLPSLAASSSSATAFAPLKPLDDDYEAHHAFSTFANWIVPGRVMLGQYPFVCPKLCLTRPQGEAQLQAILEAGVGTFVSMQDELPPQANMKAIGQDGFLPYKTTAELIQAALNGPPPMELLGGGLRNPILNKFLPPNRHHKEEQEQYKPKQLSFVHGPISDGGVPSLDMMERLLADLEARMAAGEVLYIHCHGGRGRAGTTGACLLASAYGLSASEALERVGRAYDTRNGQKTQVLETDQQAVFVRQYVETKLQHK